jgi:hypothetical protein
MGVAASPPRWTLVGRDRGGREKESAGLLSGIFGLEYRTGRDE